MAICKLNANSHLNGGIKLLWCLVTYRFEGPPKVIQAILLAKTSLILIEIIISCRKDFSDLLIYSTLYFLLNMFVKWKQVVIVHLWCNINYFWVLKFNYGGGSVYYLQINVVFYLTDISNFREITIYTGPNFQTATLETTISFDMVSVLIWNFQQKCTLRYCIDKW